ncbi:MAG: SGNH/GDSL hydrolase family protein, partial [Verrucomicrobiales bacterium]
RIPHHPTTPLVRTITMTRFHVLRILRSLFLLATLAPALAEPRFTTPEADRDGLEIEESKKEGLPNVLILGDSISIGYTRPVVAELKEIANVRRPKANCGDTPMGLKNLDQWLGDTKWDVIHFNWGLWDLCYRHPESKVQGKRDKVNGTISTPLDQYTENLEKLVLRLKKTGATLIWASTTVVPEHEAGRFVGDDVKYNQAAAELMKKHGVAINDLHAHSLTIQDQLVGRGNVHFTKRGSASLAKQVANAIRKALEARPHP